MSDTITIPVRTGSDALEGSIQARLIRLHCRAGSPVRLKRNVHRPYDPALKVLLGIPRKSGLGLRWQSIGVVETEVAQRLAARINGRGSIEGRVHRVDVEPAGQSPQIIIEVAG